MRMYVEVPVLYDKVDPEMERLDLPNGNPVLDTFEVAEVVDLYNIRTIRVMLNPKGRDSGNTLVGFYVGPEIVINMKYSEFKNKFAERIQLTKL